MKVIFFLLATSSLLSGCSENKERKELYKNISKYLSTEFNTDIDSFKYLIIMQNGSCRPCSELSYSLLDQLNMNDKTLVLFTNPKSRNQACRVKKENISILVDKEYKFERYGLYSVYDLFIEIGNHKVLNQSIINYDEYDILIKTYSNQ